MTWPATPIVETKRFDSSTRSARPRLEEDVDTPTTGVSAYGKNHTPLFESQNHDAETELATPCGIHHIPAAA